MPRARITLARAPRAPRYRANAPFLARSHDHQAKERSEAKVIEEKSATVKARGVIFVKRKSGAIGGIAYDEENVTTASKMSRILSASCRRRQQRLIKQISIMAIIWHLKFSNNNHQPYRQQWHGVIVMT